MSGYDFGKRMKAYLVYSKQTQKAFSSKCGINERSIGEYSLGHNDPGVPNLRKIVAASGISADWWLGLSDAHMIEEDGR